MRIFCTLGSALVMTSASSISSSVGAPKPVPKAIAARSALRTDGLAWPAISGPHDPTKSMYSLPSTSQMRQPLPRSMKRGTPPTDPNARTGLLTPPGITRLARLKSSFERSVLTVGLLGLAGESAGFACGVAQSHHGVALLAALVFLGLAWLRAVGTRCRAIALRHPAIRRPFALERRLVFIALGDPSH